MTTWFFRFQKQLLYSPFLPIHIHYLTDACREGFCVVVFFCNTHPASRLLAVYWVQSSGWRCCWVSGHQGGMWGCSIWTRVSWTFHSRRQRSKVISLTKDLNAVLVIYILAGFTSSDQQQFAFFKRHTFILFSIYCTYNECIFYECLKIENHPEK